MFQQGGQKLKDILIQRLKKHDEAAFEEVMNKYLPLVSNIVYNISVQQTVRYIIMTVLFTTLRQQVSIPTEKQKSSAAHLMVLQRIYWLP